MIPLEELYTLILCLSFSNHLGSAIQSFGKADYFKLTLNAKKLFVRLDEVSKE